MKAIKITFWIATAIVALMMSYSASAYLTQPAMAQGFQHLGFPPYFRVQLAIAKFIGVIILLVPVSARLKEWAHPGFAITFISAFIAHTASGDPINYRVMPLIFLGLLAVSYVGWIKSKAVYTPFNAQPAI